MNDVHCAHTCVCVSFHLSSDEPVIIASHRVQLHTRDSMALHTVLKPRQAVCDRRRTERGLRVTERRARASMHIMHGHAKLRQTEQANESTLRCMEANPSMGEHLSS